MKVAQKRRNSIIDTVKESLSETKRFLSIWVAPDIQDNDLEVLYDSANTADRAIIDELIRSQKNMGRNIENPENNYKANSAPIRRSKVRILDNGMEGSTGRRNGRIQKVALVSKNPKASVQDSKENKIQGIEKETKVEPKGKFGSGNVNYIR